MDVAVSRLFLMINDYFFWCNIFLYLSALKDIVILFYKFKTTFKYPITLKKEVVDPEATLPYLISV